MHATQIIKKPLVTEKSTWEAEARNHVSFHVDMKANKQDIRDAIIEIYKVRVDKVSTQIRKGKYFRNKFGTGKTKSWKKAVVHIHQEDKIDLF